MFCGFSFKKQIFWEVMILGEEWHVFGDLGSWLEIEVGGGD